MTIIERADNLERIILPEGYYETLAQYVRAGKTGFDSELEKLGEQGLDINIYKGSEQDREVILEDIENLPQEIREELARFAANLLNPLREQLGTVAVEVSDLALDYAVSLAQSLSSSLRYHNYDSLIAIAQLKGVEPKGKDCLAFSEYRETYTLYDAKKLVYKALIWRLFDDSHANYGHATTILGMDEDDSGVEEIGFAFSKYSLDIDWLLTHMIFIPKDWILESK
ncbi:TPA: SEC10/PgrA surface exclusion domain-containing protein [Streptococcus suis]|uniref:SEC10/PgrA surface exclusion domain-containing protein n=1 Tax=Streptococcus suis TaxID=1307 RepID=UPI002AA46505|nr:SEC10/PgrA surface exclusion domain-containing protein [Streptococcus suis]HEM5071368.1 SEC10/PgrA surface exclusion domain-containing protein [Streptococcus suis]HEM5300363.1 SEC10/PgrA surface exclusion domain-containing protein [Streptococcus suis]HEM5310302.1 SEC10/PgrA surface exclusion domain-containing protein [Streptococcus suis]HEM5327149.1 SEC10/PgrA surface exclusion domain-containing protein [Streptococcus suis]